MATGRIFINYRREDSSGYSGRIYDFLSARFPGKVFRDIGSIGPGADWQQAIGQVISQSDACIVVIGCHWLKVTGQDGKRRLDDPNDTVRQEIFAALQRGIAVIPVLVDGAEPPKPQDLPPDLQGLCAKNALFMTEQEWSECCQKLAQALKEAVGAKPRGAAITSEKKSSSGKWLLALAAAAALILITLVAAVLANKPQPAPAPNPTIQAASQPPNQAASEPPVEASSQLPVQQLPAVQQFPEPKQTAPIQRPMPPVATPASLVGNWNAVVNSNGAAFNEIVELYGDHSFRVLLNGASQAVGRWQSDPLGQIVLTNGTNFNTGLHFICGSRSNEDGAGGVQGNCSDQMNNIWSFSMSHGVGIPLIPFIPRVDVSQLSLAERAAFIQVLSIRRCTCPCGMSVYMCLQKDPNCNFSPAIARNALSVFLRATRGG